MPVEPHLGAARDPAPAPRLMISGWLQPGPEVEPVEVRRAMTVVACDGMVLGWVAAVQIADPGRIVVCILLQRPGPVSDYRTVPPSAIAAVVDDCVTLQLTADQVDRLPAHEADARSGA